MAHNACNFFCFEIDNFIANVRVVEDTEYLGDAESQSGATE